LEIDDSNSEYIPDVMQIMGVSLIFLTLTNHRQ